MIRFNTQEKSATSSNAKSVHAGALVAVDAFERDGQVGRHLLASGFSCAQAAHATIDKVRLTLQSRRRGRAIGALKPGAWRILRR